MAVQSLEGQTDHRDAMPYTDLTFDIHDSNNSALRLTYWIRPKWREYSQELEIKKFTDGITNTLLKISRHRPGASQLEVDRDAILMRAYGNGTDVLIDRDSEATSHGMLAERGMAPPLLGRFRNGLLYGFIPGYVCKAEDLAEEPVWRGIAQKLGEWHARIPISGISTNAPAQNGINGCRNGHVHKNVSNEVGPEMARLASRRPSPNVWSVMQDWINTLPANTEEEMVQKQYLQKELERSFHELDTEDGIGEHGFVFAHRDLLCANVIQLRSPDAPAAKTGVQPVTFIDYEYATPAPAAFDIANHFAEWVGYDCDYNMIPTRTARRNFLREYMVSYTKHTGQTFGKSAMNDLFREVDRWRGIPGLHWGIWALIQAKISDIDFDYTLYAQSRLGEYAAFRGETDGTRAKHGDPLPLREQRWAEE